MVSFATASARCFFSLFTVGDLTSWASAPSPLVFFNSPRRKSGTGGGFVSPVLIVPGKLGGSTLVGFSGQCWNSCWWCCGFARRCKGDWDKAEDSELEAEILEFMSTSGKPKAFPSKKQLIDAGRTDLVAAISGRGGWLAMGWDLDDDDDAGLHWNADIGDWDYRMSKDCGNGVPGMADSVEESHGLDSDEVGISGVSHFSAKSSDSASSSGRSLETTDEDDSGIEGILKRLEKERNINFAKGLRGKGNNSNLQSNDGEDEWHERVADIKRSSSNDYSAHTFSQSKSVSNFDGLRNSLEPAWKTWSLQRAAASSIKEFEADETRMGRTTEGTNDEVLEITESSTESSDGLKKTEHNHIQKRLKSLELELSSVLGTLRSKADDIVLQEVDLRPMSIHGHQKSSEELRRLSDAWEFQENEIMNAHDKLRSIRAKLAVLEGKMALAIIDAQKIVDVKQRRIDDARKALRLLRTAFVVWTNPAAEVLLVGSYDGWATKRKMEKSSSGIFSLYLKLYPGRYEIKFIVDGEWKIDPLRPIVNDSGHENNLLIIT